MSNNLAEVTTALAERLLALAGQDSELKSQLRQFAKLVLELIDDQPADAPAQEPSTRIAEQVQATIEQLSSAIADEAAVGGGHAKREPLPELTLGRSLPAEPTRPAFSTLQVTAADLGLIESRCRLKAEASRWAATRRRSLADGASFYIEIEPMDRDIIARAKELPNCFLWMSHSTGPSPSNLSLYEQVAGCFEAVAEAVALIKQIRDESEADQIDFEAALDLLAEAQSALRVAVETIEGPPDTDQNEIFHWLKATATETQIFIRNFMRLDNPADPEKWPELINRVEVISLRVQEAKRRRTERKRLLGKVRHKTSVILIDPDRAPTEWDLLIGTICELVSGGLPPSNRELRELLLPVIDGLPDKESVPVEFERVLTEVDRYLATYPPPESPAVVRPSKEVAAAAELLRGKSLVLIGGEKRQGAHRAIKEALGLRELVWIETRAHESFESFGPYVTRPDVVAVLLAIRWSSHSYGEVKIFCDAQGKPLIRLPGGYNPNQVAAQIMAQASDRLQ